jgi:hypothetical protein
MLSLSPTHSKTPFSIVGAIALSLLVVAAGFGAQASTQIRPVPKNSSGGVFDVQGYSGMMMGGLLWENNSFPFQDYASTSSILALPAISSWLSSNGYTPSALRPYLSMYPSQGNPYDFSQGGVTVNGTSYNVYEYIVTNSTYGLVIGAWVGASSSLTVAKIFTYETSGPGVICGGGPGLSCG